MRLSVLAVCIMASVVFGLSPAVFAQESENAASETVAAPENTASETTPLENEALSVAPKIPEGNQLTLGKMIREGGGILWVIIGLSFFTFILVIYNLLTVTPAREVPPSLIKRVIVQIRAGDLREAYQMCEERDELLANVIKAGLKMSGHDRYVIQEAMESEGERGATALWQRISYVNNVGSIAPLLGLLGTVWGMIRAFGAIAFEDTTARGLTMAYSVSQAMITTAAGLMLAIPALVSYYYLRGRVIRIIAEVEAQSSEVVEVLTRGDNA